MTPEENVKIAQNAYAAFLRGDIAGVLGMLDDNIEWNIRTAPSCATR
jgi:ketosteroid isomerase-like protein